MPCRMVGGLTYAPVLTPSIDASASKYRYLLRSPSTGYRAVPYRCIIYGIIRYFKGFHRQWVIHRVAEATGRALTRAKGESNAMDEQHFQKTSLSEKVDKGPVDYESTVAEGRDAADAAGMERRLARCTGQGKVENANPWVNHGRRDSRWI